MKRFLKQFHYGGKGFTLIELLVVIAIVGALAAVAIPNVSKFIGRGKTEAYETELHNVQTAVKAMLADSTAGTLDKDYEATDDMDKIKAKADGGKLKLSDYLTGLDANGKIISGCTYAFTVHGRVTQTTP